MRMLVCLACATLWCGAAAAQGDTTTANGYKMIRPYDLSRVINADSIVDDAGDRYKRSEVLGFIDTTYQRFYIHFTSFTKDLADPYLYKVKGKTKVRTNICDFEGTMRVIKVRLRLDHSEYPSGWTPGYAVCDVLLNENKSQPGTGIIAGKLTTDFVIDSRKRIMYDAQNAVADGYRNNQFRGTWTSYKTKRSKPCNWGDSRIPDSGPLDGGDGEFAPMAKYLDRGWRGLYQEEAVPWWK